MEYVFECNDYYGYIVYNFITESQQKINVYFLPLEDNLYRSIVWAEDGNTLNNPHHIEFQRTIYNIVDHFDDGRNYIYESYAE